MNDNLETLYKLIEEIEKDLKLAEKEKKERQKARQDKIREARRKKYFLSYILSMIVNINVIIISFCGSSFFKNKSHQIFNGNEVVATNTKVQSTIDNLEEQLNITIPEEKKDAYLVLDSILNNSKLTDNEKQIAYELLPIIEENEYLNKENAYEFLSNLDINFTDKESDVADNVVGNFYYYRDLINIYRNLKDESNSNYDVLRHELIHCIFNITPHSLPISFEEGMTEILTNEYYAKNPYDEYSSYPLNTIYVKMLCELVGPDTVLKSYTTGNMDEIYLNMSYIKGTKEEAENLILSVDNLLMRENSDKNLDLDDAKKIVYEFFNYGNTAEIDDAAFRYYKYLFSSITSKCPYESYIRKLTTKDVIQKAYFSKKLSDEEIVKKLIKM